MTFRADWQYEQGWNDGRQELLDELAEAKAELTDMFDELMDLRIALVRIGIRDIREGQTMTWSELKKELGLE